MDVVILISRIILTIILVVVEIAFVGTAIFAYRANAKTFDFIMSLVWVILGGAVIWWIWKW